MSYKKPLRLFCFALFYLLAAMPLAAWSSGKQPTDLLNKSEPKGPSESASSSASLPTLSAAWEKLKAELQESEADWKRLSNLLQMLRTEADELRSLLNQSTLQFETYKAQAETDREALQQALAHETGKRIEAESATRSWQILAAVVGTAAITGWALFLLP